jgi:hypothetical protein
MSADPSEVQKALYRQAFIRNCFNLILLGYGTLRSINLQSSEETDITGEIVRCVREALEDKKAEPWMLDLEVIDDPPQNVAGKLGKRRPRIDIEFVRVTRGPRPRFHIEAKRLYRSGLVAEYLGNEGLGMFVAGTYAARESSAGMLGYVQCDDCQAWLEYLGRGISRRSKQLELCAPFRMVSEFAHVGPVHSSGHMRKLTGRIDIYHLMLAFV